MDSVVSKFIDRAEKKVQERSTDQQTNEDNTIFERNGTSTATLREFSNEFVEWAIHHRITEAAMIHILNVLHRNTSNLNLPIKVIVNRRKRFTEKVEDIGTNDFEQNKELNVEERITADDTVQAIKKDWDKHIFTDDSLLEIDVCINGCEAFCGRQEKNLFCSVCKEKRFSNCCPYSSCRNKPYSFCNPFEGKFCETSKMLKPPHKLIYRTPQRRIFYRSIIQNLAKLHLGNRKNNNVNGISSNLSSDYLMTRRFPNDGEMEDVVDSPAWKNINSAMRTYFHLIAKPKLEKTLAAHQMNDYKIVPFFDVINCFSDSLTLFKRKNASLYAYLTSVTNCDPKSRMVLGRGLFLTYLHTDSKSSPVAKFVMEELLIREQQRLELGVAIM